MSAFNFIRLYGPFTMLADPGGHLSLGAAILAEYDWRTRQPSSAREPLVKAVGWRGRVVR